MTDAKRPGAFSRIVSSLSAGLAPDETVTVFEGDSDFCHIAVRDRGGLRTLYMGERGGERGDEPETSISIAAPTTPVFEYPGMMLTSLAISPLNRQITLIGLGGGFIPRLFQEFLPDRRLTVVEVDPMVAEIAGVYFFFTPGGNVEVAIADGLDHLASMPPDGADQIWLDAFNGNYIPPHMATDEFLETCRSRLKPGGLLLQNVHQTRMDSYRKQLRRTIKVFGGVPLVLAGRRSANAVFFSSRQDGEPWMPPGAKQIAALAKEFGPQVGPYDLSAEAFKRVSNPDWVL
jgi:spermidine synthase